MGMLATLVREDAGRSFERMFQGVPGIDDILEGTAQEKLRGPGYEEIGTGVFVPEEDAYEYVMERISQDDDLRKEFEESTVEWFYSGNWIKED